MRAAVQTRYGPPEVVRICEVEKATAKESEVLVKGSRDNREPDRPRQPGC